MVKKQLNKLLYHNWYSSIFWGAVASAEAVENSHLAGFIGGQHSHTITQIMFALVCDNIYDCCKSYSTLGLN